MSRTAVARAVSIVGHPVVLVPAAGLIAASNGAASLQQLQFIGGALLLLAILALGFSWFQVRAGRWAHIDASARGERSSLNVFLAFLFLAAALLLWMQGRLPPMAVALALSSAICIAALLMARWVKLSLHTAFAAFATALLWPIKSAVVAGAVITIAVVWSRLVLRRHVPADIVAGLLLGVAAGIGYQYWAN